LLLLVDYTLNGRRRPAGTALVNTVFSIEGFLGPSLIGWFKDRTSSTGGAFQILAALLTSAASLCIAISRHLVSPLRFARSG
jgi:ACS family tartrate transporter-like MFS transporter